jgi:hypothetical protein
MLMRQTVIPSCHNEQSNSIKHRVMGVAKQRNMLGFSANLLARTFHFAPPPNCAVKGTKTAGCFFPPRFALRCPLPGC